jgi:site-specific DNA-methyltransferase (adenine-specific)
MESMATDDPVRLHLGNCLDVMGEIADGSIDLVLCDLPYGVTACRWDTVIPFGPLWAHYRRLLKPRGAVVLTASQPFTSMLVTSNPKWFKYEWIWEKSRTSGFINARKRPLSVTESVLVFAPKQTIYNPQYRDREPKNMRRTDSVHAGNTSRTYGRLGAERRFNGHRVIPVEKGYPLNLIRIKAMGTFGGKKVHPTQKPVALMEYLIRTYTDEGDTVLDNAMGSGTTLEACINTGRKGIGIESHEPYFRNAENRIAAAIADRRSSLQFTA